MFIKADIYSAPFKILMENWLVFFFFFSLLCCCCCCFLFSFLALGYFDEIESSTNMRQQGGNIGSPKVKTLKLSIQ